MSVTTDNALKLLEEGEVSFSKAAKLAGLNIWDFADLIRERKVVWIKNKEFIKKDTW